MTTIDHIPVPTQENEFNFPMYDDQILFITSKGVIYYKNKKKGVVFLNNHSNKYLARLEERVVSNGFVEHLLSALNQLNKE
jgi:hypothetical protein